MKQRISMLILKNLTNRNIDVQVYNVSIKSHSWHVLGLFIPSRVKSKIVCLRIQRILFKGNNHVTKICQLKVIF